MKSNAAASIISNVAEYESLVFRDNKMPLVYGPTQSRRFGFSLGINLLGKGPKVCSMNCGYCDLGPTELRLNKIKSNAPFPSLNELEEAFRIGLQLAHDSSTKVDSILVSGNGEPTLHPQFSEAIDVLMTLRAKFLPAAKLIVLTNGAHLDARKVTEAVNRLDERILKIDGGNEAIFKLINAPLARTSLSSILGNAHSLKNMIVQSLFVQGAIDNTRPTDIDDWIEAIGLMKPKLVHIHTISRVPQANGLLRADEDTLYTIASRLERRTQIKSLVFP